MTKRSWLSVVGAQLAVVLLSLWAAPMPSAMAEKVWVEGTKVDGQTWGRWTETANDTVSVDNSTSTCGPSRTSQGDNTCDTEIDYAANAYLYSPGTSNAYVVLRSQTPSGRKVGVALCRGNQFGCQERRKNSYCLPALDTLNRARAKIEPIPNPRPAFIGLNWAYFPTTAPVPNCSGTTLQPLLARVEGITYDAATLADVSTSLYLRDNELNQEDLLASVPGQGYRSSVLYPTTFVPYDLRVEIGRAHV